MSYWDKDEFRRLQKTWYRKIKNDGFKDIESENGLSLKEWNSNFFKNRLVYIKYQCTLQYYQKGSEILQTYSFENQYEKKIWQLHMEGMTVRQIAKTLKSYKKKKSTIHTIIEKIARTIKRD